MKGIFNGRDKLKVASSQIPEVNEAPTSKSIMEPPEKDPIETPKKEEPKEDTSGWDFGY